MIELNEFDIPRKELLKLLFRQILIPCGALIAFWFFPVAQGTPMTASLIILIAYLVLIGWLCWLVCYQHGLSSKNTFLYQKRKISFDADKIHVHAEDGSEVHILLSHILQIDRYGAYYRLFFLHRLAYIPIPVSAFRSEEDRIRFETEVVKKISPRATLWRRLGICLLILACIGFIGWGFMLRSNRVKSGRCCEFRHSVPVEQLAAYNHLLTEQQCTKE